MTEDNYGVLQGSLAGAAGRWCAATFGRRSVDRGMRVLSGSCLIICLVSGGSGGKQYLECVIYSWKRRIFKTCVRCGASVSLGRVEDTREGTGTRRVGVGAGAEWEGPSVKMRR